MPGCTESGSHFLGWLLSDRSCTGNMAQRGCINRHAKFSHRLHKFQSLHIIIHQHVGWSTPPIRPSWIDCDLATKPTASPVSDAKKYQSCNRSSSNRNDFHRRIEDGLFVRKKVSFQRSRNRHRRVLGRDPQDRCIQILNARFGD